MLWSNRTNSWKALKHWHFAWFPILYKRTIRRNHWVWLQWVERIGTRPHKDWEYKYII